MLNKFAEDLKKQREANGVSLQEVALKTKLNIGTFDKMENGDFSFEISAYVRAYLKQYAICIELNPDEVLKDFDLAKAGKYKPKVFESKETDKKETVKEEIIITETEKELSKVEPDKSEKNIDDKQTEDLKTEKNEVKEIPEKMKKMK